MDRIYLFSFVISAGKQNIYGKALLKKLLKTSDLIEKFWGKETIIKFICQIYYLGEKFFLLQISFFLFWFIFFSVLQSR